MRQQLSNILENFEILQQVDTRGVPPTAQPNTLVNVMKDDVVQPSLPQDEVLANAPRREDNFCASMPCWRTIEPPPRQRD